jgi:hypothetical protein
MKQLVSNHVFYPSLLLTHTFNWAQKASKMKQSVSIFALIAFFFTGMSFISAQRTLLLIMNKAKYDCVTVNGKFTPILSITLDNGSFSTFGTTIEYVITGGVYTTNAPLILNVAMPNANMSLNPHTFQMPTLIVGTTYTINSKTTTGVGGYNTLTFVPTTSLCSPVSIDTIPAKDIGKCPTPLNLITNGNFMYGNDGSFQSGLAFSCNSCTAGSYCIGNQLTSKCNAWAANTFDHTLGNASGSYMIVDGDAAKPSTVWSSSVCVQNDVIHTFSFWVKSIYPASKQTFDLGFIIDGVNKKTVTIAQITPAWTKYEITWTSNKTACIPIAIQQLTGGAYRDFGIDDIFFGYCSDCNSKLIQNGEFIKKMPNDLAALWSNAYGSPLFNFTVGQGYLEDGYAEMKGDQIKGDAVAQQLAITNQIRIGKKYKLTVAVRFMANLNTNNYGKIRAIAFNGALPTTGTHPLPNANVAIIGRSGKIRDCGDWSFIEFPLWIANKDFQNIALNVFSDNSTMSTIWIDDVVLCETDQEFDCTEVQLDQNNNPIIPASYGTVPTGFNCTPEAEEDSYLNGSLQDLYGQLYGYNGTSSLYSQLQDKCLSIGGILPPEVINYNCDDSLKALGINMTCEEFQKQLNNPNLDFLNNVLKPDPLPPLKPLNLNDCSDLTTNKQNMAFNGKDIIFVHGLMLSHLCDRSNGKPGSTANWPDEPNEFYNGYYNDVANTNWKANVEHYLNTNNVNQLGGGYRNRYLIVTYNCSQSAEIAVHCVLSQIREAMENGKGVVYDDADRRKGNCFGRDYICISHSTGAIIADVALSIANKTKTDNGLKTKYGDIGVIADRCKGRLSIRGAFSGSSLATIMVAFQATPSLSGTASFLLSGGVCNKHFTNTVDRNMVLNSVLVDLIPAVTRYRWGSYINTVPVPVLTIASGHPSTIAKALKYVIHPGFDDGVVTMDCASSFNNSLLMQPTRYIPTSTLKAYDMGQPLVRGICYFLDQHLPTNAFAYASTPYLSPTGMVQPVSILSPTSQFNNHYTFIQSASEHWLRSSYDIAKGYDYEKTIPTLGSTINAGLFPNDEEELVVTDPTLFSRNLVSPAIISEMGEFIKGKYILLPKLVIKRKRGIPHFSIVWIQKYIWKRTYHKMQSETLFDFDYAYKYLFKN